MPLYRTYREADGLLVGVWKADETDDWLRAALPALSPEDGERLARFAPGRRHEWLAVRVLLKTLCGEEKQIAYHPSGRPCLPDGSHHISISHTRGYAAVALHPSRDVGVDIEQRGPRVRRVAPRFLRPNEASSLPASGSEDELSAMLLHWSAKETLFKLIDREAVDFQRHLRVLPFRLMEEGTFLAQEYLTEQQCRYPVRYVIRPDFVLTWAVKSDFRLSPPSERDGNA